MTMGKFVSRAAALLCLLAPTAGVAQDNGRNQPGQFDFYVLSLSWSPILSQSLVCGASFEVGPEPSFGGEAIEGERTTSR